MLVPACNKKFLLQAIVNSKSSFSSHWNLGTKNLPLDLLRMKAVNHRTSASVLHLPCQEKKKKVGNVIAITTSVCENVKSLLLTLQSSLFTPAELSEQYARFILMDLYQH